VDGGISVILPRWYYEIHDEVGIVRAEHKVHKSRVKEKTSDLTHRYVRWYEACNHAETRYLLMLRYGASPQEARNVLPNSLKTEIIITMNLRQWRHFFRLRTALAAHPQMREMARMQLQQFQRLIPVVFDDILLGVEND
jgi:thymidylate synthase (FAD)